MGYLQGRVRVREELSKVLLFVKNDKFRSERPRTIILGFTHREPRSGLRSRNRTGFADAGFVEALSILIGCAIRLSSWLHPDDSINKLVRSVGSRSWSESFFFPESQCAVSLLRSLFQLRPTSIFVVAPVTTTSRDVLIARSTLINDEVRVQPSSSKQRCEVANIDEFVIAHLWLVTETIVIADDKKKVDVDQISVLENKLWAMLLNYGRTYETLVATPRTVTFGLISLAISMISVRTSAAGPILDSQPSQPACAPSR